MEGESRLYLSRAGIIDIDLTSPFSWTFAKGDGIAFIDYVLFP